ncbi:MAG: MaoC family dehydratase N-terminal domain-containing protein [Thermoflexaceae bacterium]|nr:MaoC family dehydratase N-terminal domain-containing protein [Thermoflexaceae bacterium]
MTQAEEQLTKGYGYADKKKGYGQITDEAVAALASRIGVERTRGLAEWELDDSRFTAGRLRRIALASGDYNPLYTDMDYARKSPYGTLIAPPWVITGIEVTNAARDGMPGLHAWFRGTTLEWDRPIKLGDYLTSTGVLTDVRRVRSQTSGEAVVHEYMNTGYNQRREVVGRMFTSWHRAERETSKGIARNQKLRGLARYSPEDLMRIREDYAREVRRGAEPRFWEDVRTGEELPFVVKGPTNQFQRAVGESGGGIGFSRGDPGDWAHTHANAFKLFERHPGLPFVNEWGIPEIPLVIHNSNERCQRYLGLPGAYDAGYQRINWTIHMLTNWSGDLSFLRKLNIKFPSFNIMGDTTWCYGRVFDKRLDGDAHVVSVEVWNDNQLGQRVTSGEAEIVLPTRSRPGAPLWPA